MGLSVANLLVQASEDGARDDVEYSPSSSQCFAEKDDERTLAEEEMFDDGETGDDEIAMLQKENEMPLQDLLRLHYAAYDGVSSDDEEGDGDGDSDEDEDGDGAPDGDGVGDIDGDGDVDGDGDGYGVSFSDEEAYAHERNGDRLKSGGRDCPGNIAISITPSPSLSPSPSPSITHPSPRCRFHVLFTRPKPIETISRRSRECVRTIFYTQTTQDIKGRWLE